MSASGGGGGSTNNIFAGSGIGGNARGGGGQREKTYFEQQREALIGDIAMVCMSSSFRFPFGKTAASASLWGPVCKGGYPRGGRE